MSGVASTSGDVVSGPQASTGPAPYLGRLRLLSWAFMFFNSVRLVAYLPTTLAICASGDSSQHSLWTWCTWLGANLTMAAWLHEHNARRMNKAILMSVGNAVMCLVTVLVIVYHRW